MNEPRPWTVEQGMRAATIGDEGEQPQARLFGQVELPAGRRAVGPAKTGGPARVLSPQRDQVESRAVDLESLLGD